MGMNDLSAAFKLIERNQDKGYVSGNKTEELVLQAEQALNISFPTTYRLFLKQYGCGGIGGSEIYGLTRKSELGFKTPGVPDGIWLTLDERKTGNLPSHFIIISDTGDGYWYCLDASQADADGEYPVVIWGLGIPEENKEKVNEDFGEFLLEQVISSLSSDDYTPDPEKVENDMRTRSFWDKQ